MHEIPYSPRSTVSVGCRLEVGIHAYEVLHCYCKKKVCIKSLQVAFVLYYNVKGFDLCCSAIRIVYLFIITIKLMALLFAPSAVCCHAHCVGLFPGSLRVIT